MSPTRTRVSRGETPWPGSPGGDSASACFPKSVKALPGGRGFEGVMGAIAPPLSGVRDGLPANRSRLIRDYVEALEGAIRLERLPAYAPELNPVEYIRAHLKQHEVAYFRQEDFAELTTFARRRPTSMQRCNTLVSGFWKQAEPP